MSISQDRKDYLTSEYLDRCGDACSDLHSWDHWDDEEISEDELHFIGTISVRIVEVE